MADLKTYNYSSDSTILDEESELVIANGNHAIDNDPASIPLIVIFVLHCLYIIPCWYINIRIYRMLKAQKQIKMPFYRLCLNEMFLCTLYNLLDMMFTRFSMTGVLRVIFTSIPLGFHMNIINTTLFYLAYASCYATSSLTIMRFTAVWIPIRHNHIWDKGLGVHIMIAVIYLLPIANCWFNLFSTTYFAYSPEVGALGLDSKLPPWLENKVENNGIMAGTTMSVSLICLVLTCLNHWKLTQLMKNKSNSIQQRKRNERNMHLIAVTTFTALFLRAIVETIIYTDPSSFEFVVLLLLIRPFISDATLVVLSFTIYLTHPGFKKRNQLQTVTVTQAFQSTTGKSRDTN